jgi:hypothetical protein
MKIIIYSKLTNLPCGEVLEGDTPKNEINRSAIPSFGGTEEDYSFIEANQETYKKLSDYHFTIIDGEINFGSLKEKIDSPTDQSLDDFLLDLDYRISTVELGL